MKNIRRRLLSLIVCFSMVLGNFNQQVFALNADKEGYGLSFVSEEYTEPTIGVEIPNQLQLTSIDGKTDLSNSEVTMQWLKQEGTEWSVTDEQQFNEGEYRLAISVSDADAADGYAFHDEDKTILVNGEEFEHTNEQSWQINDNKASFEVVSKVYKLVEMTANAESQTISESEDVGTIQGLGVAQAANEAMYDFGRPNADVLYVGYSNHSYAQLPGGGGPIKMYLVDEDVYNTYCPPYSFWSAQKEKELNEKSEVAYCFNYYLKRPVENFASDARSFYFEKEKSSPALFYGATSEHVRLNNAEQLYQRVLSVALNGYPNNYAGIKEKYGLSDDVFRAITQYAVWYYTDSISIRLYQEVNYYMYADDTNTWLTKNDAGRNIAYPVGYKDWWNAYNELLNSTLDSYTRNTSHINLYKNTSGNYQDLLTVGNEIPTPPQPTNENSVKVQIPATKLIDNGQTPIGNNTFKFKLTGNGVTLYAESDADGNVVFPEITYTEPGTYTYTIEEVTDARDGVSFNFDKSKKTVTVTISEHDLQTYDPDSIYYAFEEYDYDSYYYVDTVPGGKGIVMYCTNADAIGPQYTSRIPARNQTYKAVINPTAAEINAQHLVNMNLYGDKIVENLKKLFHYFETEEGLSISNNDKQALVWSFTDGTNRTVDPLRVNGMPSSKKTNTLINYILETEQVPSSYNLAFFVPTGSQANGYPQPLATGYGAVVEATTNKVTFNNTTIEEPKGNLVVTKTLAGDITDAEVLNSISFSISSPNGGVKEYKLNEFVNKNGKYTLELNDVEIGTYIIQENKKTIDGKTLTVTYKVNNGAERNGTATSAQVIKGETANVDFTNTYSNDKGNLVITKTLEGEVTDTEAKAAIEFKVTAPDGTSTVYTLNDFNYSNGKYTLELKDVLIGEYTVEETKKDINGKTVTVTYVVNSGNTNTGTTANAVVTKNSTANVDFTNTYSNDKGNLVITKTLEGDVTEEEAEGAITFTVTGPDGTSATYTLDKFTKGEDGKYTLTLEDVVIGEYTVEETTKDVDGKNVTVTYTINSGAETEGDSAKTEVTEGETTTVDFNNSYENKKGKLVITKTIEGDVTEEEAEGAITFTVTGPNDFEETYTLKDFDNEDGKYTLTLEDVVIGEYTVEETTKDVDGKNVTVTYTINSGDETEGDSAKAEVTEGETTTVDFNNAYTNDKGNLVITKTLEGEVTDEEAKAAIEFKVTAPDGTSTVYTLNDFKFNNGEYVLELNNVVIGNYTVEETKQDINGKTVTVTYTLNNGETRNGTTVVAPVIKGETAEVDFRNAYANETGKLVITKTIEGDVTEEEAEGAITFTVTGPDDFEETYTLKDFENEDGKYTLTLEDVVIGEYTVEETTKDVDGKNVTVTYKINSGEETEGDSAKTEVTEGETTTVDFNNSYENKKGKLVITKTIEGDVTEEEAEGAITFTVTGPDGNSTTYTLDKFTKGEDGKYTLTLEDVVTGEYTVEETTKDVDGKNVTVTYTINSGAETEGDSAKTEVTEGETTTVDFNNSYENKKGKLVITKTIEGDVTEEEAEGAITFTVTGPDGNSTTYTLDKFTKGEDGKYTLTLEDVVIGEYTVEETTKDVDGKNVTVTYKINSGAETEGDSAKTEVTEGETTTVDFNNSYENKKGKLVITKTIEGDVTEEEAEGAITFTVTGPDDFEETYTLKDFDNEDGKYTLTLEDVVIGEYTVEETTKDVDGKNVTVTYKINSGEETEGDSAKTEVTEGETTTVDFNNSYENKKGMLVITKTIEGDVTEEEAEGAITFTVTGPDDFEETYTLKDFENEDGKYTLTLEDVVIGEYTVEETTKDVDGKNVTVTYTINSGAETEGDSAKTEVTEGETTTVDFNNSYENKKGKLVITKTIEGDVTEEEAEGAITFTVTGPDGNSTTYTLDKFTKGEDGKYTLTLEDVVTGEYTVEETTKDVDGKNVTVTYKINSGEETEGDSAKTEVTEGETTTVDFNNSYENKKGKLVITKTIEGDVTEEEAEGAITFTVTGPDGNSTTYTLDKFTKGEDGKYTLTLEDVVIGEYTVEETTKDVDGKNVTVTYTINSGAETEGDSAKTEVTEGETTTVDFNNEYTNDKGSLVITKTLEGEVTDEEAKNAIEFKVTAPDGTSTVYTLNDFKFDNGEYVLELNNVVIGNYTVEETKQDINGKTVTVTYTLNNGETRNGTTVVAPVIKGETAEVDFRNAYANETGKLVITKTIEGDVTEEEAEGAITFTVTGPDGTSATYTLDKFTKGEDGKYTLTLEDVVIGEYTVEETTKDVDGKNVTVTYKINSGEETEGDSAKTEVTEGETTTVDFNNSYENKKGKLVITKTIEGDVTEEEAEGAITFTVTGPDGNSTTYTLDKFTKGEDGKYTLTLEDVVTGEYTVEETTKDVDGKNVTVTYTINSGAETEGDSAKTEVTEGETTTVDFNNSYENKKGKLVITKTIEGDVTEEEAEGAITFTVTGPDDFEETYTLKDFENEDGKYTLTLEDVVTGEYTVEETTKDVDGKNVTVTYKINSGAETEGDSAKTEVTEGETTTVDFNNEYTNDKGNLVITKTLEGEVTDEEAKNAIEFKVTAPDGTSTVYTLNDFKFDNGEYVLELNDVVIGNYTVEETKQDINGKTVTVTYTLNNGETRNGTTVVAPVIKGETAEVDFRNSYANETGKLVITKTIEGDVTEEEAEGAITFTVTGPDGNSTTYTLDKFTKGEDGKYTLTLEDVVTGEYTVEETTKDVDGKNVTVTYKINSGEETEGDSAKTEVTEGETTTVDFNNSYENKKGKLVITKTIEGDVTEEEAEGAITFTVTGPDDFEETYTLKDFKNEDGKYTLELNDVVIGEYTVEETTKDVDGKNVTVTYKINSGAETEGDSAKTEVTEGETTTVDFNNEYTNDKGNLVITKTLVGEVTDEEAKNAIEFKVTAPDGTSTVYTLNDFKFDNGEYVLELNDVVIGNYTVEETKQDINGKTVTVTYTLNNGETRNGTTVVAPVIKGETAEVDFRNAYANETGKLVITKTIEGDVTEEEAEGAITFTVTGPDGNSTTYTLDKFTKGEDGKYTLTLEDVVTGEYTVEETTKDVDGKNVTVTYKINSGAETEGDSAKTEVTEGETTTVDFNNSYENKKGKLVITKTIEGDVTEEEAEGAITFTVTGPDDFEETYTLKDFDNEDGKYTLTLEDVVIGEYTVEETTKDVDGKNVTVTYKINSGEETEGDSAKTEVTEGETTTVDFNNSYENKKGMLVITKTIEGDVTEEEAEGAITFTVTGPDDFEETYTLKDFENEDGKYTLTLEDVVIGEYTVEETTKDVDGKNVTVTYTINSGAETEGDSAKTEVTEGETTTVDFNNSYENKKGKLVITKTIEGDVTEEEAEGAITFTVTGPDGNSTTYTLDKFTKGEDGKYTLTLEDVVTGEYTVEETTKDVDGKNVTVTYKINSGEETEGDSAKTEVTEGETTTVDFNNSYENKKGKLVITKTIEGDVTEEEAEGAITFTVTGPDGNSTTYTLDKFTKGEDGKYTLTLEDVVTGEYTVEETTKDVDGKNVTVTYKINSGEETEGDSAKTEVTEGETTTVDFNNSYENKKGKLVITKTIEGDVTEEEAEGAITFTVTGPDDFEETYTLKDFENEDGKYTLTLEDVVIGEYTVEETTKDVDGKNVTVTYTINSGAETEGDSAKTEVTEGETTTVDFNNSYENKKGKLVITKTIEGDVTEEEAEGAITFTVTGPDGNSTTYTLDKFTKGEDGKYTLTLEDVVTGEYTVEETTKDVDGKNVTVTYKINSGEETEGDSAKTEVTEGETTTVDFNNSYENKKGKLVITKTIEGDVTEEEAEGAITFTVTGPDGNSTTYTLDKFTKGEDGKYTLTLEDVVIGEYTVEETTKDVDGKNVTVTYTINSGDETEGDSAKAEVTEGETTTVDFNNSYENKKGKLVITKTIEGDVTEEEAEGAITFTVTGPDGNSTTYTLDKFTKGEDGKYTLTLEDVVTGEYTVEETTKDVDGKNVTVTYKINSGEETEGDSAKTEVTEGETTTVDFNNSYENKKGKLVITKTIEGDVTEEEAEGAITFTVTGPDGNSTTYTLDKFTKGEDGKYTLTLEDVVIGEYTVEETTKDVDGKNVTVTYTINSGAETEGDSAKTEVTEGETTTVDFNNSYENEKPEIPNTGDHLVFSVASSLMFMSLSLLIAVIYVYKKFLNI